jgi:transcriptional regulator with XRE-family HTH domain
VVVKRPPPDAFLALIALRLKMARELADIPQTELAATAKVPQSHISDLENGYATPSLRMLVRLADVLGCNPGDLLPTSTQVRTQLGADYAEKLKPTRYAVA